MNGRVGVTGHQTMGGSLLVEEASQAKRVRELLERFIAR